MSNTKKTLISILAMLMACTLLAAGVFAAEAPAGPQAPEDLNAAEEARDKADPVEGSWILYEVYELKENAEPVLLKKEENQSLYGSGIGIYTFDDGGYAHHIMFDAGDEADEEASWGLAEPMP